MAAKIRRALYITVIVLAFGIFSFFIPLGIRGNAAAATNGTTMENGGHSGEFADDSVIVRVSGSSVRAASLNNFYGIEIEDSSDLMSLANGNAAVLSAATSDTIKVLTLKNKGQDEVLKAVDTLNNTAGIVYAEPNYIVHLDQTTPDDPYYETPSMWGVKKIHADDAWDIATGSDSVLVAVIDSGADYNHEDLAANIWTNPGETAGDGIDNDGNGYIDDIHGWGFLSEGNDSSNSIFDTNGHGTHVSGIIGGAGNNGTGAAGVNWNTSIMVLKIFDNTGNGETSDIVSAINYANMMGAQVANCSFGSSENSKSLEDAMKKASNMLFVVASGNDGKNIGNTNSRVYPACYDLANMITVAATDKNDSLASFSNYNSSLVEIAATGVDIFSTTPGNTYGLMSGTSMATPFVTGAAALVLSQNPDMTPPALKSRLVQSADTVSALNGKVSSGGRLNVYRALLPDTGAMTAHSAQAAPADPAYVSFAGGAGTSSNPYKISTPEQLNSVRQYSSSRYSSTYFVQITDIDMTFDTQNPDGLFYYETQGFKPIESFYANYDGGGYSIKGLKIARADSSATALFIDNNGTISNLALEDCIIIGHSSGAIAQINYGTIDSCYVSGRIISYGGYAGGIVCTNGATIKNCYNAASVFEISDYDVIVGGIASYQGVVSSGRPGSSTKSIGTITDCYNIGELNALYARSSSVGGIISYATNSSNSVKNCYSAATVSLPSGTGNCAVVSNNSSNKGAIANSYCLGTFGGGSGTVLTKEQMRQEFSFSGWDFEDVWQIVSSINNGYPVLRTITQEIPSPTYGFSLSAAGVFTFDTATEYYSLIQEYKVKVNNIGNTVIDTLNITLTGEDADAFTLSAAGMDGLEAYDSVFFSVTPKAGLAPQTYRATVAVDDENQISKTFEVSFTVNQMICEYSVGLSVLHGGSEFSFGVPGWETVNVTKIAGEEKISYNSVESRLEIADGLALGEYYVEFYVYSESGGATVGITVTVGTEQDWIDLNDELESLKSENAELEQELENLNGQISANAQDTQNLENRIAQLESSIDDGAKDGYLRLFIILFVFAAVIAVVSLAFVIKLNMKGKAD